MSAQASSVEFGFGGRIELTPGVIQELLLPSGGGKTALGAFLSSESARIFQTRSPLPYIGDQERFIFHGAHRPVEYLSGNLSGESFESLFSVRSRLEALFEHEGSSCCEACGGALRRFSVEHYLNALGECDYLGVLLSVELQPESSLPLIPLLRSEGVTRILLNEELIRLGDDDAALLGRIFSEAAGRVGFFFGILDAHGADLEERFSGALKRARVARGTHRGVVSLIALRGLKEARRLSAQSDLRCESCLREYEVPPERTLDGRKLSELTNVGDLQQFKGQKGFSLESILPFLGAYADLSFSEELSSLPPVAARELELLRLLSLGTAEAVVYIDGILSPSGRVIAQRLAERRNVCLLAQPRPGTVPLQTARNADIPRDLLPGAQLRSRKLLLHFLGLVDPIAELYGGLPLARRNGLGKEDFRGALCFSCRGVGFLMTEEVGVGFERERCSVCLGAGVRRELLPVSYEDLNFSDLLALSIREAYLKFRKRPEIASLLERYQEEYVSGLRLGEELRVVPRQQYLALQLLSGAQIPQGYFSAQEFDEAFMSFLSGGRQSQDLS